MLNMEDGGRSCCAEIWNVGSGHVGTRLNLGRYVLEKEYTIIHIYTTHLEDIYIYTMVVFFQGEVMRYVMNALVTCFFVGRVATSYFS